MKYMGSKSKIAKHILPIILKDRSEDQWYIEPFVGGCNTMDKVSGPFRLGGDSNEYLIAMWKGLQQGWHLTAWPHDIDKSLYDCARDVYTGKERRFEHLMNMTPDIIGWIGWMGSFNGRFFDGGYSGKSGSRDYINEQIRNTLKQVPLVQDVVFANRTYDTLRMPINSIIYCDPPYQGTKQYATSKGFDHDKFWQWCRDKAAEGHRVYVSEYNAPSDFTCMWSMEVTNSLHTTKTYKPIEKLFTVSNTKFTDL